LKALYVVGANPIGRLGIDPFAFAQAFVVVQDMFLTETAIMADVVLPAANAYEKSGTFTNTCGDLQIVKKAGEVTATKSDFEMIVRIADAMGFDVRKLVPFGRGTPADMGQSRGAQSGEADRHAVWLEAHGLEPKMSPFDPMAILDEIQRLVPGYDVSRMQLLADGIKFLFKEDLTPPHVYKPLYIAAPMLAVALALTSIAVIPIGNWITIGGIQTPLQITDVNIGLLIILGVTSLGVYGVAL